MIRYISDVWTVSSLNLHGEEIELSVSRGPPLPYTCVACAWKPALRSMKDTTPGALRFHREGIRARIHTHLYAQSTSYIGEVVVFERTRLIDLSETERGYASSV